MSQTPGPVRARLIVFLFAVLLAPACQCEGDELCFSNNECGQGEACCTAVCVPDDSLLCE
ncbi:MAG: hypothetical protein KC416_03835 [Myxococcales bacterium]|nr:hypothetical protein [Myxococcales bacterium]